MTPRKLTQWMLTVDLIWTVLAFISAGFLRYGVRWGFHDRLSLYPLLPFLVASLVLWVLLFHRFHLDGFHGGWRFPAVASRLLLAIFCLMSGLLATAYLAQRYVSRLVLVYFGILLFLGFLLFRYFVSHQLRARRRTGNLSRIVVVGSGTIAREVANKIERHPEMLCEIAGFLFPDDGPVEFGTFLQEVGGGSRRVSTLGIVDLLRSREVDELIVALSQPTSAEMLALTGRCREAGIRVSLVPQPYELYLSKPTLFDLDGLPLLQLNDPTPSQLFLRCKRATDLILASVLSILALPILIPAATALWVAKREPFCWDTRCGHHGRVFTMLRLNVPRHTIGGTRLERWLEGLSVTELPQLWNVLRGQMSLVGPRPESPNRTKRYTEWQQRRLSVKPGITGLAQVYGLRDSNSSEDKTRYDLQYLLYPSLLVDVSLLLQTIWTLVRRVGRLMHGSQHQSAPAIQPLHERREEATSVAHRSQSSSDQLRWRRN